tara:strand:- start:893 stop:1117 length:225 start_codon:yes stop_codon:yes gene_type:complete
MEDYKYVVLGKRTHFEYTSGSGKVWCTHGGWGGKLVLKEDGSCSVAKILYPCYEFTNGASRGAAADEGLIDLIY